MMTYVTNYTSRSSLVPASYGGLSRSQATRYTVYDIRAYIYAWPTPYTKDQDS
jgi:hypothetical protein